MSQDELRQMVDNISNHLRQMDTAYQEEIQRLRETFEEEQLLMKANQKKAIEKMMNELQVQRYLPALIYI